MVLLAGCGLKPVYGTGQAGQALHDKVAFVTPATEAGFSLRKQLEARLGVVSVLADYTLTTTLSDTRDAEAVTSDGDITRFSILGSSDWTLEQEDVSIASGTVETFTSYAATGSTVATQAAEDAAIARLSVALADLIVADLLLAIQ